MKQGFVPALRFPEFENSESWNNEPLEDIYEFKVTNSLSREKLNYDAGTVKNIHYGDIHTKFSTLFDIEKELVPYINATEPLGKIKKDCYCIEGDMVFADASEDLDDVGKSIEVVNLNNEKLVAGLHTLLARQKEAKLVIGFGGYLFKSNRLREQIKKEAQGAKVLGISAGRMSKIEVAYPSDKKEQQKIADCLSSLDELIAAHTQKHQALQSYKKGLLQNFFPTEGETVPALRFPEFENTGDWTIKPMKKLFKIGNGKDHKHLASGDIPVYGSGGYMRSVEDYLYDGESACIGRKGTIDKPMFLSGKFWTVDTLFYTHSFHNCLPKFIYLIFQNIDWRSKNEAGGVPSLSKTNIEKIEVAVPDLDEQQKITDCLFSVDELIDVQAQKIKELESYKKGLMQQLFPSVDEVEA